jgi:DNA-directed RNA polymerase specialized sigma24 family protein
VNRLEATAAPFSVCSANPEEATALAEVRRLLEHTVDGLPASFRIVIVMRDVEELSIDETALLLRCATSDGEHTPASRSQAAA